jgi:dihydrolipoamide dehydrogenase
MSDVRETQLLVIGGGPGGYPAALHAADHGIKTTLVD